MGIAKHQERIVLSILTLSLTAGLTFAGCGSKGESTSDSTAQTSSEQSSSTDTSDADSTSTDTSDSSTESAEDYTGTWKLAALETDGVTSVGSLSEFLRFKPEGTLTVNDDGTGSFPVEGGTASFKWTDSGDDAIQLDEQGNLVSTTDNATTLSLKDGVLFMAMEQEGVKTSLIYTRDGVYDEAVEITMDDTEAVTSEDDLLGEWLLTGIKTDGVSMTGSAEDQKKAQGDTQVYITFKEGGAGEMTGEAATWEIKEDGTVLNAPALGGETFAFPIKIKDEKLYMDGTGSMGDDEYIMVFEKK